MSDSDDIVNKLKKIDTTLDSAMAARLVRAVQRDTLTKILVRFEPLSNAVPWPYNFILGELRSLEEQPQGRGGDNR